MVALWTCVHIPISLRFPDNAERLEKGLRLQKPKGWPRAAWREIHVPDESTWTFVELPNGNVCGTFRTENSKLAYDYGPNGRNKQCGDAYYYFVRVKTQKRKRDLICLQERLIEPLKNPCQVSTEQFKNALQSSHNQIRKSAGLPTLRWNDKLAQRMSEHFSYQEKHRNCRMEHSSEEFRTRFYGIISAGENLLHRCTDEIPLDATEAWGKEIFCYSLAKTGNPCGAKAHESCDYSSHLEGIMVGHYTAITWAKTTELGCAYHICKKPCQSNEKRRSVLVGCMYSPAGNVLDELPFSENVAKKMDLFTSKLLDKTKKSHILPQASNDEKSLKDCYLRHEEYKRKNPWKETGT
ncbi:SCP family extracellular subfamily protein [Cardiosporidium cionae]|uniref:SCP family extracellular subfamily protein n=1 Tax=Cardiosporidium cionae TaxID=476202 RepID=A0ABQ7JE61_9APIC|nr:SCP family extracellular subfamily protein [Cardiosporidium cionae]|eukprot:KAF8821935.1 SCP family extracellular subfamily protein [Cardiosporidium cionae]